MLLAVTISLMTLPLPLVLALRYLRARRRSGGNSGIINFISGISLAVIALGIAAMIVIVAVFNGFEHEIRSRLVGMVAHVTVAPYGAQLDNWQGVAAQIKKNPEVVAVATLTDGQAMIKRGSRLSGVFVRGIDPTYEQQVTDLAQSMKEGKLADLVPQGFGVLLGSELARELGV